MTDINDLYEPGDDREPAEPDEYERQPVDLEEVEQRLERLKFLAPPFGFVAASAELNGTEDLHDLAALIGQEAHALIAELREARERIAGFEALPTREEWVVTGGPNFPDEPTSPPVSPDAGVIAYVGRHEAARLWRRTLSVHPLKPIAPDAPF